MLDLCVRDRFLDGPKEVKQDILGRYVSNSTRLVDILFPLLLPDSSALLWVAVRGIVDDAVEPFGQLFKVYAACTGYAPSCGIWITSARDVGDRVRCLVHQGCTRDACAA